MFCPEGLAASISAAAVAIASGKSADELNLLATVFMQLGDTLTTISVTRQLCENSNKDTKSLESGQSEDVFKEDQED